MPRIKAAYKDLSVIVPFRFVGGEKVEELSENLAARFGLLLGEEDLRIKELKTSDGYLLCPRDNIVDVVQDNDRLILVDLSTWMEENISKCEYYWSRVSVKDHQTGKYLEAMCGRHKENKLYVAIKYGGQYKLLELFDRQSLRQFGKDGNPLVARKHLKCDEADWEAEISFVVSDERVTAVELMVRTTSDPCATIKRLCLTSDFKPGEVEELQQNALSFIESGSKDLPLAVRSGEFFEDGEVIADGQEASPVETLTNKSTGTSPIEFFHSESVDLDRDHYDSKKAGFTQSFYHNFTLVNTTDIDVSIMSFASSYQSADKSEWVPMETRLGSKSGYYNYYMRDFSPLRLGGRATTNVALGSFVFVPCRSWNRHRRAHSSFPVPLRVRIELTDQDGEVSRMEHCIANPPLRLRSISFEPDSPAPSFLTQVDDKEGEGRLMIAVVEKPSERRIEVIICHASGTSRAHISVDTLVEVLYRAKKAGVDEWEVNEACKEDRDDTASLKTVALVDREGGSVYAIRFELATATASVVEHYLPPRFLFSR